MPVVVLGKLLFLFFFLCRLRFLVHLRLAHHMKEYLTISLIFIRRISDDFFAYEVHWLIGKTTIFGLFDLFSR